VPKWDVCMLVGQCLSVKLWALVHIANLDLIVSTSQSLHSSP
jgi:hypothetical protein